MYHAGTREVSENVVDDLLRFDECIDEKDLRNVAIFSQLYYSLEYVIGQVFRENGSDKETYPNASFSVLEFLHRLQKIKAKNPACSTFLDVGCGLGNKVWLAQQLGFDAYGLDINARYAEIAREFVGKDRIYCEDGVTFPNYGNYDLIYFFNPMPTPVLERAIIGGAKQGALIYHPAKLHAEPDRPCERLSKQVLRVT